jgi:hypothetical protein
LGVGFATLTILIWLAIHYAMAHGH